MRVLEFLKQYIEVLQRGRLIDDIHDDVRTVEEKSRDYVYGQDLQLPGGSPSKRIKKLPFEAYDQQRTSSCGAHAAAHARRLETREVTFPLVWYRSRSNFPKTGMFLKDVLELLAHAKTYLAPANIPQRLTEEYANAMELQDVMADKDRTREYFSIKPYDANAVWEAVSNGFPTVISFYSTIREWGEEMVPMDEVWPSTARVRHYVVALPNSVHSREGYEWVTVVDSSRQGGFSMRHIRKDFLEQRMYHGGGFVRATTLKVTKPKDLPTRNCAYGDKSEAVLALQKYLVTQGLMEERHTTSYYGNITAKAVLQWQLDSIVGINVAELIYLEGKHWGPLSVKAVVNKHS